MSDQTFSEDLGGKDRDKSLIRSSFDNLFSFFFVDDELKFPEKMGGVLSPQVKAQLLYEHCVASDRRVGESTHNLFTIAEHYAKPDPEELDKPETINGIPPFFAQLTQQEKSNFCYNQVIEALATEALPVTIESLRATKRATPNNPASSYAGRFVRRVTRYVVLTLLMVLSAFAVYFATKTIAPLTHAKIDDAVNFEFIGWILFGCIGALVHLLNHALTTTRLKTFELSEERKVGPRILLGGMFGFVLPWIISEGVVADGTDIKAAGSLAAFFGGYSVRFSIGLLERVLNALFPDTKPSR